VGRGFGDGWFGWGILYWRFLDCTIEDAAVQAVERQLQAIGDAEFVVDFAEIILDHQSSGRPRRMNPSAAPLTSNYQRDTVDWTHALVQRSVKGE
jgi:hypothetical protein